MKQPPITAERLRELLDYDPETGIFRWKKHQGAVAAGAEAGHIHLANSGHVVIGIDWRLYRAHRLAWLWMTGNWPKLEIDHRDRQPANNRWQNLREATRGQNEANKVSKRTLPKGVCLSGRRNKPYVSKIKIDGITHNLGRFVTVKEAHDVYLIKARQHFGEFMPE